MKKVDNRYLKIGMCVLAVAFVIVALTRFVEDYAGISVREAGVIESELDADEPKNSLGENPNIRVLLMTNGYSGIVHPNVSLSSGGDMEIIYGDKEEMLEAGEILEIAPDDERFANGTIKVQANGTITVHSLNRGYGTPSYDGSMELYSTAEGIVVINELPVESYLCAVVPSEMPASYELEALKAQAVCARSYAYRQMENYGYPEYNAHVNDSTDYQVYGNSKPKESSIQAVNETAGETVQYNGNVVTTYYYSTSSGKTTTVEAWGTKVNESNAYLQSVKVSGKDGDYEKDHPWYRWTAEIPVQTLSDLIGLNTGEDIGTVENLEVTKRGPGEVALEIKVSGTKGNVTVETENKIRTVLGGSGYQIVKQDGTVADSSKLLPSAFFSVEKKEDSFIITGGGFGHGIGMSQNGANEMAKAGKNYKEILQLFYSDVKIK